MSNTKKPDSKSVVIGQIAVGMIAVYFLITVVHLGFKFGVWLKG